VVDAMGSTLTAQLPGMTGMPGMPAIAGMPTDPAEAAAALAGPLSGMLRSIGGAMFGAQVGQALGSLADEVVGSTDVGFPLGPTGTAALLPANVAQFGEGLQLPADQVRLYLALREAAHQRLFASAPWLRARLTAEVEGYARGITIDTSRIEEALGRLDPSDPAAMQEALGSGLFEPENTPQQQRVLARLEGLLALVEGWVDEVVDAAATPHLPAAAALRETVRRRRATGGPAEQTFAALVGLELRPRRLREAAALWRAVVDAPGVEGRDALWGHPDLMPSVEDLDDPAGFAARQGSSDWDISTLTDGRGGTEAGGADSEADAGADSGGTDSGSGKDEPDAGSGSDR
jgi:putative hydrolase